MTGPTRIALMVRVDQRCPRVRANFRALRSTTVCCRKLTDCVNDRKWLIASSASVTGISA